MIYVCFTKNVFENEFQILFHKVYSLILKGLFLNPISILEYANKAFMAKLAKFFLKISLIFENLFLTKMLF
jgi:hypothetical protein